MAWGFGYGGSSWGYSEDSYITFVKRFPAGDSRDNEPNTSVSVSIRDSQSPITNYSIRIDGVLAVVDGVAQEGFTAVIFSNAFRGYDVSVTILEEFELDASIEHLVFVEAFDALGATNEINWRFFVRELCYDGLRFAIPVETQRADPVTMAFLKVWDGIFCFVSCRTTKKFRERGLFDTDNIPVEALATAFEDVGLVYPDFDEVSETRRRRILKNQDAIHRSRYSVPGLQFYISLLVDATVEVLKLNRGNILFFNSDAFGFPTPAMMDSSQTDDDVCTYLIGPRSQEILVKITGNLSEQMKEFLRNTIYREIPMSDDPTNPLNITIEFIEV